MGSSSVMGQGHEQFYKFQTLILASFLDESNTPYKFLTNFES